MPRTTQGRAAAPLVIAYTPGAETAQFYGRLTVRVEEVIREALAALELQLRESLQQRKVTLDLREVTAMDTVGALLLVRMVERCAAKGISLRVEPADDGQQQVLTRVQGLTKDLNEDKPAARFMSLQEVAHFWLIKLGRHGVATAETLLLFLTLLGQVAVGLAQVALGARRFRWNACVRHMKEAGVQAIPIVALIAFLISIVLAYQGAASLRLFGAQQYSINLVAVSLLREMGGLLAAIMVAGRSGSAFASEIGVMKLREEVDALRVMGLDTLDVLVLPRVVALVVMLPLLTFVTFVAGYVGGGVVALGLLGTDFGTYTQIFIRAVAMNTFLVGLVKAPFFALLIALISCKAGLMTGGSADSLGRQTTLAVVRGIFAVLMADALFSVFFAKMGW